MFLPPIVITNPEDGSERVQVGDATIGLVQVSGPPLKKTELELCHVEQFCRLAEKLRPDLSVEIVEQRDRPDFRVRRRTHEFGLDLVAFAFTERREAIFQFRFLKEQLRAAYDQGRLRQCEGICISVEFGERSESAPRKVTEKIVTELIDAFEKLRIDKEAWKVAAADENWVMGGSLPFPMGQQGKSSDGTVTWRVPGLAHNPSNFVAHCGFQLEHAYLETVTASEVKLRVNELVSSHDKLNQGIHELLIVAGGPDKFGEGVFDEAMVAHTFVTRWNGAIAPPNNLRRVILHNWISERIDVLYEDPSWPR